MVLVAITSQPSDSHVVSLDEHDYVDGKLPRTSFVKVSKLFTTHPTLVLKKVCAIKPARLNDDIRGFGSGVPSGAGRTLTLKYSYLFDLLR